jgi:hypothetical protein
MFQLTLRYGDFNPSMLKIDSNNDMYHYITMRHAYRCLRHNMIIINRTAFVVMSFPWKPNGKHSNKINSK